MRFLDPQNLNHPPHVAQPEPYTYPRFLHIPSSEFGYFIDLQRYWNLVELCGTHCGTVGEFHHSETVKKIVELLAPFMGASSTII